MQRKLRKQRKFAKVPRMAYKMSEGPNENCEFYENYENYENGENLQDLRGNQQELGELQKLQRFAKIPRMAYEMSEGPNEKYINCRNSQDLRRDPTGITRIMKIVKIRKAIKNGLRDVRGTQRELRELRKLRKLALGTFRTADIHRAMLYFMLGA